MNIDQIRQDYRDAIGAFEALVLRRYTGSARPGPRFEVPCRGRIMNYEPAELVGTIKQGDRRVVILAEDLVAAGLPLPVTGSDKLVIGGRESDIVSADHDRRRIGGVTIAIELQVRG